jgi:hypothetical protein
MSPRGTPGFWRERARGVGYLVLVGAAVLAVGTVIAAIALLVTP